MQQHHNNHTIKMFIDNFFVLKHNGGMSLPNFENAQQLAEDVISKYSISEPVVPIYDIAQAEGVIIKIISMPENLKSVSGFIDSENKIIYVNAEDAPNRQTFTVAHELGHYLLKHDPKKYGVLLRFPEINGKEPEEKEANCFAANLLVPQKMLKETIKKYSLTKEDKSILAQMFGVSKEVMKLRLMRI